MRKATGRAAFTLVVLCSAWSSSAVIAAPPPVYIPGVLGNGSAFELVQVDPAAPAAATSLRTSSGSSWPQFGLRLAGTFSPPYSFTDRHVPQMFYPKDNRIYKTSLLRPGAPAPVQVSSEAGADQICSIDYVYDTPTPWFFYHLSGPDGQCFGFGDDQIKAAHLDMGPGDAPGVATFTPSVGKFIIGKLFDSRLQTIGWLGLDGKVLKHYDAAWGNGTSIATFTNDVSPVGTPLPGTDIFLLRIDDDLHAYNTSTRALSGSLYKFASTAVPSTFGLNDGSSIYFVESTLDPSNLGASTYKLARVPSDGSSAPVPLAAGSGGALILLTAQRVILTANTFGPNPSFVVLSIAKTGGAPVGLFSGGAGTFRSRVVTVSEQTVYANLTAGDSAVNAVRVRDDGTGLVTIPNASWIGHTHAASCSGPMACDIWPLHLLRVEGPGVSPTSFAGTLKSFSATTEADVATLGTLPGNRFFALYRPVFGSQGTFNATSLTDSALDLFYFDADVPGSLVQVRSGGAAPPAAGPVTVVEYYNVALNHYFITWVPAEIAKLDAGVEIRGWTRTTKGFRAYTAAQPGTSPVCRYYIPPNLGDSHFYGRGTAECAATGQSNPGFTLEDSNFMHMFLPVAGVCPTNTDQVYRVFSNRADANHRYMTEKLVRDQMVASGWLAEGDGPDLVVMCAPR